jgi:hypothetical protein
VKVFVERDAPRQYRIAICFISSFVRPGQ